MGFVRQPVNLKKARKILSFVEGYGFKPVERGFKEVFIYVDREKDLKVYVYHLDGEYFIVIPIDRFYIPFIDSIHLFEGYPLVRVDEGAAKAILRGADLMAPGIKSYTGFEAEDLVVVSVGDSFIAVGEALEPSSKLSEMQKGKVVKILHYKGDKIWKEVRRLQI